MVSYVGLYCMSSFQAMVYLSFLCSTLQFINGMLYYLIPYSLRLRIQGPVVAGPEKGKKITQWAYLSSPPINAPLRSPPFSLKPSHDGYSSIMKADGAGDLGPEHNVKRRLNVASKGKAFFGDEDEEEEENALYPSVADSDELEVSKKTGGGRLRYWVSTKVPTGS